MLNPDPYSHATESRMSKPASRMPSVMRSCVLDPANARRCPPGLRTRRHSSQTATGGTKPSHSWPMKPRAEGRYSRFPVTHWVMVSATWAGVVLERP